MKKIPVVLMFVLYVNLLAGANPISVKSPNGKIQVNIKLTDRVYYDLEVDGKEAMWYSPISMTTSQGDLGINPVLIDQSGHTENKTIKTVWGMRSQVNNNYHELILKFEGGYALVFRAYNDGVAYRFQTNFEGELLVYDEEVEYRFWKNYRMVNLVLDSYTTSYEQLYTRERINDVKAENLIGLPAIIDEDSLYLSVLESDLYDYPGMYLSRNFDARRPYCSYLDGKFAKYPTQWEKRNFNMVVTVRADYIAKTVGKRNFPWRVIAVSRNDSELADSDLVYKLARPLQINSGWVKPGKVAWDWWNALNLTGVDFETGVNNKTYDYFIDFAAKNNIEYVMMDAGWSDPYDLMLPTPHVNMEHLTQYAKQKGVKLILWCVWHTIDRQYKEAFALFEKWGIAGVKIDFIDRDDQLAIEFEERLAKAAAEHHLLVDYHGCGKPTGLHRTYPNVINFEGVRGNEYNKFSQDESPGHSVDIVFARMMAGPLDYTPGAMTNSSEGDWYRSFENPMSQGTRCHQLGMFVVYYAPLQMLCDAPTAYEKYPNIHKFLAEVPTTWDETKVLDAKLGEYIVIARKKGDDWYIGGMTNWDEREIEIDLSQFATGNYQAELFTDGINANRKASDYQFLEKRVSSSDNLKVTMKKGGGFAAKLHKLI